MKTYLLICLLLIASVTYGQQYNGVAYPSSPYSPTLAVPTASPVPGTYFSTQTVTLSAVSYNPNSAIICYTTDGTTPTATTPGTCSHGTQYSSGITISTTTTINAIASEIGFLNSAEFSGTYTISSGVAFDAVGPSSSGTSVSSGSNSYTSFTLTWSHTVTSSQSNLLLCVGAGFRVGSSANVTLSATYNGVSMTSEVGPIGIDGSTGNGFGQLFCLVNPATGTNSVVVTATYVSGTRTTVDSIMGGSVSFYNVNQSSPIGSTNSADGASGNPSVSITSATNDMVLDFATGWSTNIGTSSQTNRWNLTGGGNLNPAAQSTASGSSSVTMSYTSGSGSDWCMMGVDIAHL